MRYDYYNVCSYHHNIRYTHTKLNLTLEFSGKEIFKFNSHTRKIQIKN